MYNYSKDVNGNVWQQNPNNAWDTQMVGREIPGYYGANQIINPAGNSIGHVNYTPNPTLDIYGMTNNNVTMNNNWPKY
ncbi:MAG: hypothetical protein JXR36_03305 [Bacteroidales bacterium]|nr:hypothetical protein [Bacteroidales bacterium]